MGGPLRLAFFFRSLAFRCHGLVGLCGLPFFFVPWMGGPLWPAFFGAGWVGLCGVLFFGALAFSCLWWVGLCGLPLSVPWMGGPLWPAFFFCALAFLVPWLFRALDGWAFVACLFFWCLGLVGLCGLPFFLAPWLFRALAFLCLGWVGLCGLPFFRCLGLFVPWMGGPLWPAFFGALDGWAFVACFFFGALAFSRLGFFVPWMGGPLRPAFGALDGWAFVACLFLGALAFSCLGWVGLCGLPFFRCLGWVGLCGLPFFLAPWLFRALAFSCLGWVGLCGLPFFRCLGLFVPWMGGPLWPAFFGALDGWAFVACLFFLVPWLFRALAFSCLGWVGLCGLPSVPWMGGPLWPAFFWVPWLFRALDGWVFVACLFFGALDGGLCGLPFFLVAWMGALFVFFCLRWGWDPSFREARLLARDKLWRFRPCFLHIFISNHAGSTPAPVQPVVSETPSPAPTRQLQMRPSAEEDEAELIARSTRAAFEKGDVYHDNPPLDCRNCV